MNNVKTDYSIMHSCCRVLCCKGLRKSLVQFRELTVFAGLRFFHISLGSKLVDKITG